MAYKRRGKRRAPKRARAYVGRSRYPMYKSLLSQAIKPMGYKLRGIVSISANGSTGVIDTGSNITDTSFITFASDYTYVFSLYDEFRCRAVSIKFIPSRPFDPSGTTVYAPLYVTYDVDNTTTPSQITAGDTGALEYTDSCKVKSLNKMWRFYTKFTKASSVGANEQVKAGGWQDCGNPHATQGVFITNYSSSLTHGATYGNAIVTWYVQCRNRR